MLDYDLLKFAQFAKLLDWHLTLRFHFLQDLLEDHEFALVFLEVLLCLGQLLRKLFSLGSRSLFEKFLELQDSFVLVPHLRLVVQYALACDKLLEEDFRLLEGFAFLFLGPESRQSLGMLGVASLELLQLLGFA